MQGESLLIITGSMGAGRSSVLCEASDILARQSIVHAALDLDAFGFAHLPSGASNDAVMCRNFQCVCKNYAALGVRRFLVARAIEDRAALQCCRQAVAAKSTMVCRLVANIGTMRRRVKRRESGVLQEQFVARVAKLDSILAGLRLGDFRAVIGDHLGNQ